MPLIYGSEIDDPRAFLRRLFDAAVAAVDPMRIVPAALPADRPDRLLVVGAGKASARMAEAVEHAWGPCDGLVITRDGYARPTQGVEIVEASHPEPDARGEAATRRILDLARAAPEDATILTLVSGGGSALLVAPRPPATLADKQAVTRALIASGAPIDAINTVRRRLSLVKGGRLAAATRARMLSLVISDVPGDDLAMVASGPTTPDRSSDDDARAVFYRWGVSPPPAVVAALNTPIAEASVDPDRVSTRLIGAPSQALAAAASVAEAAGVRVRMLGDAIEGEARDVAEAHAREAAARRAALRPGDRPEVWISGGECTVTLGATGGGGGVGGPNAEFALAFAGVIDGIDGVSAVACDTDGVDGAADVAGAIVDGATWAEARAKGLDPRGALADNDSHGFFAAAGGAVATGPTLTNVNDFRAVLIQPPA